VIRRNDANRGQCARVKIRKAEDFGPVNVSQQRALAAIKTLHTAIWAVMVACILAIPFAAWAHRFRLAAAVSVVVWLECGVLAMNKGRCPISNVATRYTTDSEPNFDIYLPAWLARRNKEIFGTLFAAGELFLLVLWLRLR